MQSSFCFGILLVGESERKIRANSRTSLIEAPMLLPTLLMHARAPHGRALTTAMTVGAPVRVEVQPWTSELEECASRGVQIKAMSGDTKVGRCGVVVMPLDETGFHSDDPTVRPRAVLSGTLFVEPKYRRQGVAQRLLREAETKARLWGFSELLLPVDPRNTKAIALYEKNGYVRVADSDGVCASQVTLRRNLFAPNAHTLHSMFNRHTVVG
tara:strand:- start:6 stop:641 length:636 start_codon:yes stop_codon:yes gene_type:complete